ncbi:MAG TPA: ribonuclease H-like domain-containing protein [Acholeplasmataceae bacterium]|nr:ribonuclease H-like domain-containing protein [Acholeplasmataceae bacterium]
MHIITKKILFSPDTMSEPISLFHKNFLIFDIETTGFSRDHAIIYMIGCIYKKDGSYEYCNIFASDSSKEEDMIRYFFNMLKDFNCLISFNGNNFDIPFLLARAKKHSIKETISLLESIDIYGLLRPFRKCLSFSNLKLDTVQNELGYARKDTATGGDLIHIYHAYAREPYHPYYKLLLLHNKEDVEGMIPLLPLIDIFILIEAYHFDFLSTDEINKKIVATYALPHKAGVDFVLSHQGCELKFSVNQQTVKFTLPFCHDKKKRFFENFKDYMYIPEKDEVIHKSIANFMPAHQKIKSKKSNCYISYSGVFIPVFTLKGVEQPFKDSFKSKQHYTLLNPHLNANFFKQQLLAFLKNCKES